MSMTPIRRPELMRISLMLSRLHRRRILVAFLVIALGLALVGVALSPVWGLIGCLAGIGVVLTMNSALMRLIILVAGGLMVLGSSSDVSATKVAYTGALVIIGFIAFANLVREPPHWFPLARAWLWLTLLLVACTVLSTVLVRGSGPMTIVRQGLFYLLIPLAPLIGVDVGRRLSERAVLVFATIAGTASAIGFATDWVARRGVAATSLGYLLLGSPILAGLAFAISLVKVAHAKGPARVLWLIPCFVVPVALLVTGTRTNIVIGLILLGVLGRQERQRLTLSRSLVVGIVVAIGFMLLLPLVGRALLSDPTFLDSRMRALLNVIGGAAEEDQSYSYRAGQYAYAIQQLELRPVFGFGLGWAPAIVMDTPLVTVVKLGFLGVGALLAYFAQCLVLAERLARRFGYNVSATAMRGLAVVVVALIPFGSPLEDRGFCFALALVFAGISAAASRRKEASDGSATSAVGSQSATPARRGGGPVRSGSPVPAPSLR